MSQIVAASPHVTTKNSTAVIMRDVLIALCPALIAGCVVFGLRALLVVAVTTAAWIFFEWGYEKLCGKPSTICDLSAAVTGVLLALCLPVCALAATEPNAKTIEDTTTYEGDTIRITIDQWCYAFNRTNLRFFVANVYVSDPAQMQTAFAGEQYSKNNAEATSAIAERHNAILAINGDYYNYKDKNGLVIRNGVLYRDAASSRDQLLVMRDGTFIALPRGTYAAGEGQKYIDEGTVQIAPLAYMRGRTLDNAFVILDEAQNTTLSQLKMFLTRMGRNAKFIVTGDITQIDLPRRSDSGLVRAMELLRGIDGIGIVEFDQRDIIRHRLVKHIVKAFEKEQEQTAGKETPATDEAR